MADDVRLIARWMSKDLITVEKGAPVVDAFELMHENRIRHIPVVDGRKLLGIVSDRDIRQFYPKRADLETERHQYGDGLMKTKVEEVMTKRPRTADPSMTVREAAETCCREKIGALPVVTDDTLVGIVTVEDLLWAFVEREAEGESE